MASARGLAAALLPLLLSIVYAVIVLTADERLFLLVARITLAGAAIAIGLVAAWLAYNLFGFSRVRSIEEIEKEVMREVVGDEGEGSGGR